MYTPDSLAWDKTLKQVFPKQERDGLKITNKKMKEVYNILGITPEIMDYLKKDYMKILDKM
jgi:hypothetical protein